MISLALVDDHTLLRAALTAHIETLGGYRVTLQASNGKQFMERIDPNNPPAIVLLDIVMPEINGFDTALFISQNYPGVFIIALSMLYDENAIIRMLRNGARGFLVKDAELTELEKALAEVKEKGIYINRHLYKNLLPTIHDHPSEDAPDYHKVALLSQREKEFLRWLCTDMAYKEIAAAMFVSPRTIDGYRDALLDKLKVSSKIGLVTFAIRNRIVEL